MECLPLQVEVMALMTWWGLTIDTVSCINLVVCIGLCVDYSAHIGLHFMQVRNDPMCSLPCSWIQIRWLLDFIPRNFAWNSKPLFSLYIKNVFFHQVGGSRNERVHTTLREMAPAVLNGAFSTFLSFVLLAFSESHVFISFFKVGFLKLYQNYIFKCFAL